MNTRYYSMIIQWSDEDAAYLVTVPELPDCMNHGSTYEEAVQQGQDAIEGWIQVAHFSILKRIEKEWELQPRLVEKVYLSTPKRSIKAKKHVKIIPLNLLYTITQINKPCKGPMYFINPLSYTYPQRRLRNNRIVY